MSEFIDVAKRAAYQAGKFLSDNLEGVREISYKGEGHYNPFSAVDKKAEDIILTTIRNTFPGHGFLSEEKGGKIVSSDYTWIIDPLDGTINFLHKHKYFGVSIALLHRGGVILGVVYNPILDEMFTAVKGEGAQLNERSIQVSANVNLGDSLLSMGFPYERDSESFNRSVKYFACLLRVGQALRRGGSTALDLCNVACGRYDGFCVLGNELWDYAAGALLVAEAGGRVTDIGGEPFHIDNGKNGVVATNGKIHKMLLQCLPK